MRPLSCRRARALVVAARDGGLRLEARLALDEHLAACAACRALDARDAALEEALARMEEPPVERLDVEAAVRAVRAGIAAREARAAGRRRRARPLVLLALAAAAGVALALWLARRAPEAPPTPAAPAPVVRTVEPPLDPTPAPEDPVVDPERLAAARARTAAALDAALAESPELEQRLALLARPFDELAGEGWPVARLVERQLDAARPERAALAARWLGRSDDRLSLAAVAGLVRDARTPAALRSEALDALLEARERGAPQRAALLAALEAPALRPRALAGLVDEGSDARLAGDLRELLLGAATADPSRDPILCAELVRRGDAGLDALVEVAADARRGETRAAARAALARDPSACAWLSARLDERAPRATSAARLRVAAELGLREALAPLRAAALGRGTRDAALAALALHPEGEAWDVLLDLWAEGRVPESDLLDAARARLERGAALDSPRARTELEVLLALESPAAAPQLVRLAADRQLALDQRQWALEAVGELGGEAELPALTALLRAAAPDEVRVAAACALALYRLGGPAALTAALEGGETARALCALFEARPVDRNRPVTLSRASRRLEPWLATDTPGRPRTEP